MAKSSFQFKEPVVTKAIFEMLRPPVDMIEKKADVHVKHEAIRVEGKNQAYVQLIVQINKQEDRIAEDALFYAEVAMQSVFLWSDELETTDVDNLLKYNATALLISYIRPLIANMTFMSPVSTINLPFVNVNQLFDNITD